MVYPSWSEIYNMKFVSSFPWSDILNIMTSADINDFISYMFLRVRDISLPKQPTAGWQTFLLLDLRSLLVKKYIFEFFGILRQRKNIPTWSNSPAVSICIKFRLNKLLRSVSLSMAICFMHRFGILLLTPLTLSGMSARITQFKC